MKIKINIPDFGEKYYSDNVEYKLYNVVYYAFYKKGTNIIHNEYGPAIEFKNKYFSYLINHKFHRLNDYAFYNFEINSKSYDIIGKHLGKTKEKFIKNLANTLIPKDKNWL